MYLSVFCEVRDSPPSSAPSAPVRDAEGFQISTSVTSTVRVLLQVDTVAMNVTRATFRHVGSVYWPGKDHDWSIKHRLLSGPAGATRMVVLIISSSCDGQSAVVRRHQTDLTQSKTLVYLNSVLHCSEIHLCSMNRTPNSQGTRSRPPVDRNPGLHVGRVRPVTEPHVGSCSTTTSSSYHSYLL